MLLAIIHVVWEIRECFSWRWFYWSKKLPNLRLDVFSFSQHNGDLCYSWYWGMLLTWLFYSKTFDKILWIKLNIFCSLPWIPIEFKLVIFATKSTHNLVGEGLSKFDVFMENNLSFCIGFGINSIQSIISVVEWSIVKYVYFECKVMKLLLNINGIRFSKCTTISEEWNHHRLMIRTNDEAFLEHEMNLSNPFSQKSLSLNVFSFSTISGNNQENNNLKCSDCLQCNFGGHVVNRECHICVSSDCCRCGYRCPICHKPDDIILKVDYHLTYQPAKVMVVCSRQHVEDIKHSHVVQYMWYLPFVRFVTISGWVRNSLLPC